MRFEAAHVAAICREYGVLLEAPADIDGARLLWALAGAESSFGQFSSPHHQMAYCTNGPYFDTEMSQLYGCLYHCALGPWQLMACHGLAAGVTPLELLNQLEQSAAATTQFLNREIFGHQAAKTLAEVAEGYKVSNFREVAVGVSDLPRFLASYSVAMPEP